MMVIDIFSNLCAPWFLEVHASAFGATPVWPIHNHSRVYNLEEFNRNLSDGGWKLSLACGIKHSSLKHSSYPCTRRSEQGRRKGFLVWGGGPILSLCQFSPVFIRSGTMVNRVYFVESRCSLSNIPYGKFVLLKCSIFHIFRANILEKIISIC